VAPFGDPGEPAATYPGGVTDDAAKVVRDAFFVSVGLGVIAFQRVQVRRLEVQKAVEKRRRSADGEQPAHVGVVRTPQRIRGRAPAPGTTPSGPG
jgi:hypothetical protein